MQDEVLVRERERERKKDRKKERGCVCMCVCAYLIIVCGCVHISAVVFTTVLSIYGLIVEKSFLLV